MSRVSEIKGETLCRLSASLESLDVSFCSKLEDEAVKQMVQCSPFGSNLTALNLSACQKVKTSTLKLLGSLNRMSRLKLCGMFQPMEFDQWSAFQELQVLDMSYSTAIDLEEALSIISEMSQLRSLRLNGRHRSQRVQAKTLSGLKQLKCLEISEWWNIQFGLDAADVLPNLEVLNMAECYGPINSAKIYFANAHNLKVGAFQTQKKCCALADFGIVEDFLSSIECIERHWKLTFSRSVESVWTQEHE